MLYIAIDYGIDTMELPTYVIANKHHDITDVIESGLLSDFKLEDYDGLDVEIMGEKSDIQRFREQFVNGSDIDESHIRYQ